MSVTTAYTLGLLAFWAGLVVVVVAFFTVAGRDYCECDDAYEPCTCTLACEPRGITSEQRCRLEDDPC